MSGNEEGIYLLNNDPNGLIIKYQKVIGIIVQKELIAPGFFIKQKKDELIKTVSEKLYDKIPSIQKNYNGSVLLITYCSTIIVNLCKGISIKLKKQPELIYGLTVDPESDESILDKMIIDETIEKLDKILKLYHKERFKTEFCLKSYFKVKPMVADFDYLLSKIQLGRYKLIEIFTKLTSERKLTKNEVYGQLTIVINCLENVGNTDDAIRKRIKKWMCEILYLLNGNPPRSSFDEETLQILIEKYYEKKSILSPYWSI